MAQLITVVAAVGLILVALAPAAYTYVALV